MSFILIKPDFSSVESIFVNVPFPCKPVAFIISSRVSPLCFLLSANAIFIYWSLLENRVLNR